MVETWREGAVVVIAMNRPDRRNALSGALVAAIREALADTAQDPEARAVVLAGRGPSFCAGGDLTDGMSAAAQGFHAGHRDRGAFARLLQEITGHRAPVIAAVHGDALGGGCGLAAACDLVVADPDARFGTPEIKLGLFPWIILAALQRNVPRKALMDMVLTGDKVDAARAREIGLVSRVAAPGAAMEEAIALGTRVAERSPVVVESGKAAFLRIETLGYSEALDYMHAQLSLNLLTEDALEGVAAFLQKREPQWKGR